jgi:hypothetical protein
LLHLYHVFWLAPNRTNIDLSAEKHVSINNNNDLITNVATHT